MTANKKSSFPAWFFCTTMLIVAAAVTLRMIIELMNCSAAKTNDYFSLVPAVDGLIHKPLSNLGALYHGSHFIPWPMMIFTANALLFDWNVKVEIFLGFCFFLLSSTFVWLGLKPKRYGPDAILLLSILLILQFSATQIAILGYSCSDIQLGLTDLGFSFGLWALISKMSINKKLLFMVLGGIVSCFSTAAVLPLWVAYLIVILGFELPRRKSLIFWFFGLCTTMAPFIAILSKANSPRGAQDFQYLNIVDLIGRLFANAPGLKYQNPVFFGALGLIALALLVSTIYGAIRGETKNLGDHLKGRTLASCACIVYAISNAIILTFVRPIISPWYIAYTVYFWMGLCGLCFALISISKTDNMQTSDSASRSSNVTRFGKPLSYVCLSLIIIFAILSNSTYRPYDYFGAERSRTAAAVLRNLQSAPTYSVVLLNGADPAPLDLIYKAGTILRKNHWDKSFYQEEISLQEDYIFPSVGITGSTSGGPPAWLDPINLKRSLPFSSPEHLALLLPEGSTIDWSLDLRDSINAARFQTRLRTSSRSTLRVQISDPAKKDRHPTTSSYEASSEWKPIEIQIPFKSNKRLTITLSSSQGPAILDDPKLRLGQSLAQGELSSDQALPANIEGSTWLPPPSSHDQTISLDSFKTEDLEKDGDSADSSVTSYRVKGSVPSLTLIKLLSIEPLKLPFFCFKVGLPERIKSRFFCLQFVVNGSRLQTAVVPIMPDAAVRTYFYDLKLLGLQKGDVITCMKILPLYVPKTSEEGSNILLGPMRFAASKVNL